MPKKKTTKKTAKKPTVKEVTFTISPNTISCTAWTISPNTISCTAWESAIYRVFADVEEMLEGNLQVRALKVTDVGPR